MKVPDLLTFSEVCCIIFYRCADLKKSQSGSPSEAAKLVRRLSFFVLQDAFAAFCVTSDSCTLTPSFLFDRINAIASNILLASGVFMRFPPVSSHTAFAKSKIIFSTFPLLVMYYAVSFVFSLKTSLKPVDHPCVILAVHTRRYVFTVFIRLAFSLPSSG